MSIKSIKSGYRGISALVGNPQIFVADILLVAGGGGGAGGDGGGGGGAGGVLVFTGEMLTTGTFTYAITVGGSGAGGASNNAANGGNGGNSIFGSLTQAAGGGGGAGYNTRNGLSGGSGGVSVETLIPLTLAALQRQVRDSEAATVQQ